MIGDDSIIQDFRGISYDSRNSRRRLFNISVIFRNAGLDHPNRVRCSWLEVWMEHCE